jgi:hypothetical protein
MTEEHRELWRAGMNVVEHYGSVSHALHRDYPELAKQISDLLLTMSLHYREGERQSVDLWPDGGHLPTEAR